MNGSVRPWVGLLTLLSLAPTLGVLGCTSTRDRPRELARAEPASPPDWQGEALSWEKLERIQHWLDGEGPWDYPKAVPEAELELAEGRLILSQRERQALPRAILEQRLRSARDGFLEVATHPKASAYQIQRAQEGLVDVGELLAMPAPSIPPPVRESNFQILERSAWQASAPKLSRLTPNRRPWTRITVHHSALPSLQLRSQSAAADEVRHIQTVHMRDQSWGDIGYHFLIDPAGRIYKGRDLKYQGAHAGGNNGANNVGNIGICLLGDFDQERPDPRALASLDQLIGALRSRHGIGAANVKGHQDFKATQCPGRNLESWVVRYSTTGTRHASAD